MRWMLAGGMGMILCLSGVAAQAQDRSREIQRVRRGDSGHTSGSVNDRNRDRDNDRDRNRDGDRDRDRNWDRDRDRDRDRNWSDRDRDRDRGRREDDRSGAFVRRGHGPAVRRAPSRVTVIQRPTQHVRPSYRPITVIQRPITRPTYRPIRWGTRVVQLPSRHVSVQIGGLSLFLSDGVYYQRGPTNEYVVVRPPIGTRVQYLPHDATPMLIDNRTYYFYDDVWYDDNMYVVETPYGGYVESLPDEYEVVEYGQDRYYRVGNSVYEPGWRDGRNVYFRLDIRF